MRARALVLTAIVVLSNFAGNLLLSVGVKGSQPLIAAIGVGLLILWTISRMTLMSWADLTYILPVTSAGYILSVLAGRYLLAENVSGSRWLGTVLIFAGMVIVSRTTPRSTS